MAHTECKHCVGGFHPKKSGDDLVCSNCLAPWEPNLVEDAEEEDVVLLSDDSDEDAEDACDGDCGLEDGEDHPSIVLDIEDEFADESDIPEDVEFDPLAHESEIPERLGHTEDGLSGESEVPIRFGHNDEDYLPDDVDDELPQVSETHPHEE